MKQIRSHVELLSQSVIEMIHNASLRLLERTGMRVPNRTVCRLAQALGARVDKQNTVVRLPRPMMEELLEEADARARELIVQNRTDEPVVSPEIARTLDELAADAVKELAL